MGDGDEAKRERKGRKKKWSERPLLIIFPFDVCAVAWSVPVVDDDVHAVVVGGAVAGTGAFVSNNNDDDDDGGPHW